MEQVKNMFVFFLRKINIIPKFRVIFSPIQIKILVFLLKFLGFILNHFFPSSENILAHENINIIHYLLYFNIYNSFKITIKIFPVLTHLLNAF